MSDTADPGAGLADEVIHLLVAMSTRLGQHFAGHAAEFGLTAAEAKVLLAVEPDESLSMRAIADRIGYDASNLTGVVDKLEQRHLAERCPHPADRRVKAVRVTEPGVRLRRRMSDRLRADAGPVRVLSTDQLRELRALLRQALEGDPAP